MSSALEDDLIPELLSSDSEEEFIDDESINNLNYEGTQSYKSYFLDKFENHKVYMHQRTLPTLLKPINFETLYKKPPFKVGTQRLMKSSYWKHVDQRLNDPSIDKDEIDSYIQGKIEKILHYFEKLYDDNLDEEDIGDRRAGKFDINEPYLPDPAELEVSAIYLLMNNIRKDKVNNFILIL